ncbi:MAG: T9SS type A sorting domain-containing protein, partial [Saprospiraceae bacterium]
FEIDNVWDKRVRLSWTPSGVDPVDGWYVVYGPVGFSPAGGNGDTLFVNTPKATVTGLTPYTDYDVYVQTLCSVDTTSELVGPITFRTYRSNDVGISAVLSPQGGCDLGFEQVEVRISNYGANPQSLLPLNYNINGNPSGVMQPADGFYTGVLGKDSSDAFQFDLGLNLSLPGEYLITVFTQLKGDEDTANDTLNFYLAHQLPAPYAQGFEVWDGGWRVDSSSVNASWAYGKPQKTVIDDAANGETAWVTSLDAAYNDNELSYLVSPCFNFSDLTEDPVIELSIFRDLETDFDGAFLDLSTDDGQSWQRVGTIGEGLNWYTEDNLPLGLGHVWSSNSKGWIPARHTLNGAAGNETVRLRFGIGADGFVTREGFGIDDIRIRVPQTNDLAGISATSSGDALQCGVDNDQVVFSLSNFGSDVQDTFAVAYSINGGTPVIESVLGKQLLPDEVFTYTFDSTFNSANGFFEITCWTILNGEQATNNDSVVYVVDHRPLAIPVLEDFNSGILPNNWSQLNADLSNTHNNTSFVLAAPLISLIDTFEAITNRYGPLGSGYKLRFDYRITDFFSDGTVASVLENGDAFDVSISNDCGAQFTNAYTINAGNHTPGTGLKTVVVNLDAYADDFIIVRFSSIGSPASSRWFDLDNVGIQACAPNLQLSADVQLATQGQADGSATVNSNAGYPPYTYLWSNNQTTQTAVNLAEGSYAVTVTDLLGCNDVLTVSVGVVGTTELDGLTAFSLWPNPTDGLLQLNASFMDARTWQAGVTDLLGRTVAESNGAGSTVTVQFDLQGVPSGVYLLRLTADGQTMLRKVVKN